MVHRGGIARVPLPRAISPWRASAQMLVGEMFPRSRSGYYAQPVLPSTQVNLPPQVLRVPGFVSRPVQMGDVAPLDVFRPYWAPAPPPVVYPRLGDHHHRRLGDPGSLTDGFFSPWSSRLGLGDPGSLTDGFFSPWSSRLGQAPEEAWFMTSEYLRRVGQAMQILNPAAITTPRASAPAPTGPPVTTVYAPTSPAKVSNLPTWVWWAGGSIGLLVLVGIMARGRR